MTLKNDTVLVLNKHFLGIQVCDVKSAICAIVTEKAVVVDEAYKTYTLDQWQRESIEIICSEIKVSKYSGVIRSPSVKILAPQVIMIPNCGFNTAAIKVIKYSRQNIYKRDKNICQYCMEKFDKKDLTIDHVIPKSKGGKSIWKNVVACCSSCNSKKKDKSPSELEWRIPHPQKPSWESHVGIPFNKIKREYWKNFLT